MSLRRVIYLVLVSQSGPLSRKEHKDDATDAKEERSCTAAVAVYILTIAIEEVIDAELENHEEGRRRATLFLPPLTRLQIGQEVTAYFEETRAK